MVETVTIPKGEYYRLLEDKDYLACLETCGVDNWQGFDDAIDMFSKIRKDKRNG